MTYEELLQAFDGTLESIPEETQLTIIDHYSEIGTIQELEGKYDIPAEITRAVLAQPDLMQRALARRAGEFALKFVNEVLPAAIAKAASGETGSIQAAKLVASVIGAEKGGRTDRPKKEQEGRGTLEEKLNAVKQATPVPRPKLTSRKK